MSSSSSDDEGDHIYYDFFSPFLISDALLRGLDHGASGRQGATYNDHFPLLLLSSFYYREEQDMMNSVIEDSMNSYHTEMLRKNAKRRLSEDSYRLGTYNTDTCRNEKCFVCLDVFENDAPVCLLSPCNHVFHEACVKEMVQYNPVCALCKIGIPTYEEK